MASVLSLGCARRFTCVVIMHQVMMVPILQVEKQRRGEAAEGNLLENKNEAPAGKMMAAPRSQKKSRLRAKSLESDLGSSPTSTLWKPSDLEQVTSPFWVSVSHLQNEDQEG